MTRESSFTIFAGTERAAQVSRRFLGPVARRIVVDLPDVRLLAFDDATGQQVDLDLRDAPAEPEAAAPASDPRGRGRPKLGVVAREVTLLPRHWDWLNAQPGGASVALRKLVELARRDNAEIDRRREARDAAYRFASAIAGDLPGFEDASRALFAGDRARFEQLVAAWPKDIARHACWLAFGDEAA
jgi:uncharacterized protein